MVSKPLKILNIAYAHTIINKYERCFLIFLDRNEFLSKSTELKKCTQNLKPYETRRNKIEMASGLAILDYRLSVRKNHRDDKHCSLHTYEKSNIIEATAHVMKMLWWTSIFDVWKFNKMLSDSCGFTFSLPAAQFFIHNAIKTILTRPPQENGKQSIAPASAATTTKSNFFSYNAK